VAFDYLFGLRLPVKEIRNKRWSVAPSSYIGRMIQREGFKAPRIGGDDAMARWLPSRLAELRHFINPAEIRGRLRKASAAPPEN